MPAKPRASGSPSASSTSRPRSSRNCCSWTGPASGPPGACWSYSRASSSSPGRSTLVPAFIILQAALQKGQAIVVVPLLAGLSQLVPIALGMVALHEKFPKRPALSVLRIFAFALILVATVILSRRAVAVTVEPVHGVEPFEEAVPLPGSAVE